MSKQLNRCGFCAHLNPIENHCNFFKESRHALDTQYIEGCRKSKVFERYLPLLPTKPNARHHLEVDYDLLAKDASGVSLFLITNRGVEHAVPAYVGLELEGDALNGVQKFYTFQGQREMIYEYGVTIASEICSKLGIKLKVLEGEESSLGDPQKINNIKKIYMLNTL